MDPLSVILGCIAIGTLMVQTYQAIDDLGILFEKLLQRLYAVKNEVNDLGLVVAQIQKFAQRWQHYQKKIFEAADCDVTNLLEKAQINLTMLQIVISGLVIVYREKSNKLGFLRACA